MATSRWPETWFLKSFASYFCCWTLGSFSVQPPVHQNKNEFLLTVVVKGWKCWLTWGIKESVGFHLPIAVGFQDQTKLASGFYWESRAALWDVLLLHASSLPSVHSAALEMELLPFWLCLGFHFLTVEWRNQSGMVTAASQGGCKLVSFPGDSELSVDPVLTRFGLFGKLMDCQSRRAGNEWIWITQYTWHDAMCKLLFNQRLRWDLG